MNGKKLGILAIFLVGILVLCSFVYAEPSFNSGTLVEIQSVEIDDNEVGWGSDVEVLRLDRNNEVEVKVLLRAPTNVNDVQVSAFMRGYDHDDRVEDITDVFDMKANVSYSKRLKLKLPERMDAGYEWSLRIAVETIQGAPQYQTYEILVGTEKHSMQIRDIILTPENMVIAGRGLLTTVRVKNYGEEDEEGIKVQVSIPELGISASDYIKEINSEESETSGELYLRIPADAESGVYNVKVELTYDDGDEKVSKETTIEVEGEEAVSKPLDTRPVIRVGPESQDVMAGESGVIYPLTVTNPDKASKTFTISVDGVDEWGVSKISPTNVLVVGAGETKAAYISVAANTGTSEGKRMFGVTVSSAGKALEQIPLTANVLAQEEPVKEFFGFRRGLEIGLVILVVLLVIIGLVIGFNKLKGSEEEEESEEKTYY